MTGSCRAIRPGKGGTVSVTIAATVSLLVAAAVRAAGPGERTGRDEDPFEAGTRTVRVFSDADGLPNNTVHAIALDPRGVLWVGTQDGAAAYDGRAWTVVDLPNRQRSNFVRTILAARDGTTWFGTQSGGVVGFKDGAWTVVGTAADGLPNPRVNALFESVDPDGTPVLWIATHGGGLARRAGDRWTVYTERDGLPSSRVWAVAEAADQQHGTTFWVGTERGLARFVPGTGFEAVPELRGASVNQVISVPRPGGGRELWVGTYGRGIARLSGRGWEFLTTREGLPSNFLTSLVASTQASGHWVVYAGTDGGGVARIDAGGVSVLGVAEGLPSEGVYSLFETFPQTGGQALWIGTRNGGLARLREGAWRTFHPPVGAPNMAVNAIATSRDADGTRVMWFGTDGGGLARLASGRWTVFSARSSGLPSDTVLSLVATVDRAARPLLWVGTRNGGLARFAGGEWEVFSTRTGHLPNDIVSDLTETTEPDGRRTLWVATRGGLVRYDGTTWSTFDTTSGLPSNSTYGVARTHSSAGGPTLWVATLEGLARLDGTRWTRYGTETGLLTPVVQSLHPAQLPDGRRVLWAGTEGGGLSCVEFDRDPPRVTSLNDETEPRLPNNTIARIMTDRTGRLWVTTNRGVARLTPRPGGGARAYDVLTYTVADGMPSSQCTHAAGLIDDEGRVWIGTVGGATALDPRGEILDTTPKPLTLRATSLGDPPRELAAGATLSHRQDKVVFEYVLTSLYREQDTRYRTQLVGSESLPSEWSADTHREYRALPDGEFVFRVWGRDWAGNVTGPIEMPFRLTPAPWQRWWAVIAYILAGVGIVVALVGVREAAQRRREHELEELVAAKTASLQEANDRLAMMSYHDALTGLANRRHFDEHLALEWKRGLRSPAPLALLLADIDHFKEFNDTYGHQHGDRCLQMVAEALQSGLPRASDLVARYGGEEFAVILSTTDVVGAVTVAESLRRRVAERELQIPNVAGPGRVTVSVGVAALVPTPTFEAADLVRTADEALYRAKADGRDCTRVAEFPAGG